MLNETAQLLANFDPKLDAAVPEHLTRLALVHLGVDVKRGEERIEGRGRNMHQQRFIEALVFDEPALALDMFVAFVDLRSLGETGALLVHGLR